MSTSVQAGPSRRSRQYALGAAIALIAGAVLAWSVGGAIAAYVAGQGWQFARPVLHLDSIGKGLRGQETPLWSIDGGGPVVSWAIAAVVILMAWVWLVVRPIVQRSRVDERQKGHLAPNVLQKEFGVKALIKAAPFTRPDLAKPRSVPPTELGYYLGHLRGSKNAQIWVNFEMRVRIVARPGWGKTSRLLVPIGRAAPGAALIGSVKADLFEQTVAARQQHGRVRVVDFSDPQHRFADGYDEVHWDPIPGCKDLNVATRRATALVQGADDGKRGSDQDAFWRTSARQVIAAWFHAAALDSRGMADVLSWQENIRTTTPKDILRQHPGAEPGARISLTKHLDDRAEKTTSSVERFIELAMGPFATAAGKRFVAGGEQIDIGRSIRDHETIYLLAGEDTAASVSPVLTLFAEEWFYAARSLAATLPSKRLTPPAVAILDELRWLVPLPSLPAIAARDRAAGIGLVYAIQAMRQELELYGPAAESLDQAVQVSINGGYDESSHRRLTEQAGQIGVTSTSVSGRGWGDTQYTDSKQQRDVISAADLQNLKPGESVIRIAGYPLVIAYTPSFRQDKKLRTSIAAEEGAVQDVVLHAREESRRRREVGSAAADAQYWARKGDEAPPAEAPPTVLDVHHDELTPDTEDRDTW